jgi:stage II sporulation protein M
MNFQSYRTYLKNNLHYLRELRHYIAIAAGIVLGSAVLGFMFAQQHPAEIEQLLQELKNSLGSLLTFTPVKLAGAIFLNNALKTMAMVLAGIILGIFPVLALIGNGYILGVIGYVTYAKAGWPLFFASILPHGIIELPSIIVGAALGMRLGVQVFQKVFQKKDISLWRECKRAFGFTMIVIVPLLLIAACIESFITPVIIALSASGM